MLNAIANDPDVEIREQDSKGLKYIYFNTTGTKGGTESIKQLLSYLNHSKIENVTSEKLSHIHDYVKTVKQTSEVRRIKCIYQLSKKRPTDIRTGGGAVRHDRRGTAV